MRFVQVKLPFQGHFVKFVPTEEAIGQKDIVLKRNFLDAEWEPRSSVETSDILKAIA